MILSKLELSVFDLKRLNIKDEYAIHKFVYSLFPGPVDQKRDFLYVKKENVKGFLVLLIISQRNPTTPDFGRITCQKIKESLLHHEQYHFVVKVNPVKRNSKSQRVLPIVNQEELLEWFTGMAKKNGMSIFPGSLIILNRGIEKVTKEEGVFTFNKVVFSGYCNICDRKSFIKTFQKGFGRSRTYGFGLLEIQPVGMM